MELSKNFDLSEFTNSPTAKRLGIDNTIPIDYVPNVQNLVSKVLQPLRDYLGQPITVNSGYRSYLLNEAVGGVPSSHHRTAHAVDFVTKDLDKAFEYIKNNCQFTQLIKYKSGFIHVSYLASDLKKQILYK